MNLKKYSAARRHIEVIKVFFSIQQRRLLMNAVMQIGRLNISPQFIGRSE